MSPTRRVVLGHQLKGPSLEIHCCQFEVSSPEQTRLFWKDESSWQWMTTSAFALAAYDVDVNGYISDHQKR